MRMTVVASVYGHRDGSGIHRVIERLEQHPLRDPILANRFRLPNDESVKC